MKRTSFLTLTLCLVSFFAAAQATGVEICNDGIDNDGDGFIDCYDGSCANIGNCDGTFLGNDAKCQAKPAEFPKFTMTLDFASPNETTNHLSRTAIGDLDRDGIPEIVTMNRYTKKLYVLNGNNGSIKYSIDAPFEPQWEIAIANIDNDACGEIFTFGIESKSVYLYAYTCDLSTQLWKTKITNDPINFGLADLNGDGKTELYAKDEIYDAKTGTRLVKSTNWNHINGGPVAVDMDSDPELELVIGCAVYDVNLGSGALDGGALTLQKSRSEYFIRYDYSATSVADYNLDGFLDVIASGSTVGEGKNTTIFFWDVEHDTIKTFFDNSAGSYQPSGWQYGTGRVNIADLDGDGKMNVSYVSGKFLYALDEKLNLFWRKVINEETSGYTGCTLFDFNGDGKSEIVYRDEQYLYIINGTDGSVFNQQNCVSRTNREYPIVADVDADGSTEMCVPCGFNDKDAKDNFDNINYSRYSHIRVFKSAAEPWVPARRVWNQHGYFNVNVNDDLTIPAHQQKHHLVFSTGSCTTGPNRPLNGFLNQSPFLNSLGCPTYASPDLAYVDNSLSVNPPTCPEKKFTVSFKITNKGDMVLDGTVPITFYNGNPSAAGAVKLGTITAGLSQFGPGDIFSITNAQVNGPGSDFILYIVLNDNGSTIPTPIKLPNTNFVECDYGNNIISAPVVPKSVPITGVKVADNAHCPGSTTPNNGAVRAFVTLNGVENTTDFNFYWFKGTTVDATPDFVGAVYSGVDAGTYSVFARHKTASCNSDTTQVVVGLDTGPLQIDIIDLSHVTKCKNPDGSLQVVAHSKNQPPSAFTYAWYAGNSIFTSPQIGVNDIATDLKAQTYTVLVTEKLSGCTAVQSKAVQSDVALPVVVITKKDILCSSSSSGKLDATADGKTSGYKFAWYNGDSEKPSPDFNGASQSGLPGGDYTLIATNTTTKCSSPPQTVTIIQTPVPVVTATVVSDMSSCDSSKPNGAASATVTGGPAGFTFEWFKGTSLTAVNKIGSSSSINNLPTGTYTVRATHTASGCSDTDKIRIDLDVVTPTLSLSAQNVTTCTPYNGKATATPSFDSPGDYTYKWYIGTTVKAATDFPDTDNVIDQLPPGDYTVEATHKTKFCNAAPKTIKVLDLSPVISMTLDAAAQILPSDCNSNEGVMKVDVSGGSGSGFTIEWHFGRAPFSGPVLRTDNGTTSTATSLRTGVYTVTATDKGSGCKKDDDFDLPYLSAHSLDIVSIDHIESCVPGNDGAVTVQLNVPGGFNQNQYKILVFAGRNDQADAAALLSIPGSGPSPGTYNTNPSLNLEAGDYTFVAVTTDPVLGDPPCRSVPKLATIERHTDDPEVVPNSVNANTNCAGMGGNGAIALDIDGGANPADYTFQWFDGSSTSAPGLGDTDESIANLDEGFYTVKVTGTTGARIGCFTVKTIPVSADPVAIDISGAGFTTVDLASCSAGTGAVINNGSATVSSITENGSAGNLADYDFAWTDATGAPRGANSPTLNALGAGTYTVLATNTTNNCFVSVPFEIKDMTIGTVGVDLTEFANPEKCIQEKTGRLKVEATGTGGNQTFSWFENNAPTGPVVSNSDELLNIQVLSGLQTDRTVLVVNTTNNCRAFAVYTVPLVINDVLATASSSPLTSCTSPDGSVFAAVTNDLSTDYNYNWYNGNVVKASADHTGKQVVNLPAGKYTVVAVDIVDNSCKSPALNVEILDAIEHPDVLASALSPVSNCDPVKANGSAEATIGTDGLASFINLYTFQWFTGGTPIAGTATSFFDGVNPTGLSEGTYSVRATNRTSGCPGEASVAIIQSLPEMPNPDIVVLQNVTSCLIDNGAMSASVGGNTEDYIFTWYIGDVVTTHIDYTGEIIDSLRVGDYTVTATSRITGCTTGPDTDEITEEKVFPDFDFKIIPASCTNDNGFASLVMSSNVPIESIEWTSNGGLVAAGPNLENIGAGSYEVTVVSELGCSTTKDVEIGTEIRPYNGISRNGDGRNEIFNIACIENFPGNNVKIYNRAGTLVYEGDGYNNVDIYFDGKSNKGVSPMGLQLPDGTYFYVIDKRDGSKPLAGYLELVK